MREARTFLDGMNRDAAGLGRGRGLCFFFGRGSWGGAGKPFGLWIGCWFVCSGGLDHSVPVGVVEVAVLFVLCSDSELVEATRFIDDFIASFGLINSGI